MIFEEYNVEIGFPKSDLQLSFLLNMNFKEDFLNILFHPFVLPGFFQNIAKQ